MNNFKLEIDTPELASNSRARKKAIAQAISEWRTLGNWRLEVYPNQESRRICFSCGLDSSDWQVCLDLNRKGLYNQKIELEIEGYSSFVKQVCQSPNQIEKSELKDFLGTVGLKWLELHLTRDLTQQYNEDPDPMDLNTYRMTLGCKIEL